MDESAVKESRVLLRQIQDHLLAAQALAGVTQENVGMVDVVLHATNPLPELNYVLPRRNTAWVPTATIEQGLLRLRELDRQLGFQYIEGLFPPQFGETLKKIHLKPESVRPVLAFKRGGIGGAAGAFPGSPPGADLRIRRVDSERGAHRWAAARANGWQMPLVNPLLSPDGESQTTYDLVAYRNRSLAALLRVEVQPQGEGGVAQLAALALGSDDADLPGALLAAGVRSALRNGGALVFATPHDAPLAETLAALGFVQLGRLVRCAPEQEYSNGRLEQPVLAGS